MKLYCIIATLFAITVFAQDEIDPVVDIETWTHKGKTFNVQKSKRDLCWRYVHDGTRLLAGPFLSNGETTTHEKLVTAKDWAKCKDKLKLDDPKLIITDEQMEEIDRIDAEQAEAQ